MGQPPLDTRHPDLKQGPPPLEDGGLKNVVLESLGRILGLEGRVDVLSRTMEQERQRRLSNQMDRLDEAYQEPKDQSSPDEVRYQESTQLLRLAAAKFINPRGRFEDLRPEIDEILRSKYPTTEEQISDYLKSCVEDGTLESIPCPPAPPPSVSVAGETSSKGKRCTAAGAVLCCKRMVLAFQDGTVVFGDRRGTMFGAEGFGFDLEVFTHCPWCGTKLGGEE